jgi:hypothetical protein
MYVCMYTKHSWLGAEQTLMTRYLCMYACMYAYACVVRVHVCNRLAITRESDRPKRVSRIYVYNHMYTHTHMYADACIHTLHARSKIYTHTHAYIHVQSVADAFEDMRMHMNRHIHTHMDT